MTILGRPVADLVPHGQPLGPQRLVPRERVERLLREHPPDPDFARDVDELMGQTIDERWPAEVDTSLIIARGQGDRSTSPTRRHARPVSISSIR